MTVALINKSSVAVQLGSEGLRLDQRGSTEPQAHGAAQDGLGVGERVRDGGPQRPFCIVEIVTDASKDHE